MDDKCPSSREMFIRRRLSTWLLVGLVIFGGYQAWQASKMQALRNQAVQERIEQAELAEYIVSSANVAIILCDEDGHITSFSPAAEQIFGYSEAEAKGKSIHILVGKAYSADHAAAFRGAVARLQAATGNWQISCRIRGVAVRKGGQEFPAITAVRGTKYGGRIEFLAIIQPVVTSRPEASRLTRENQAPPLDSSQKLKK